MITSSQNVDSVVLAYRQSIVIIVQFILSNFDSYFIIVDFAFQPSAGASRLFETIRTRDYPSAVNENAVAFVFSVTKDGDEPGPGATCRNGEVGEGIVLTRGSSYTAKIVDRGWAEKRNLRPVIKLHPTSLLGFE